MGIAILPIDSPEYAERFWSRVERGAGCWVWSLSRTEWGYGRACVEGSYQRAHRVAWIVTNGSIPEGMQVLHACDNPPCCRPDHLFLGTQKDNVRDAMSKGRLPGPPHASGEAHARAVLTEADARKIKQLLGEGILPKAEIARCFEVSAAAVADIDKGRSWTCL